MLKRRLSITSRAAIAVAVLLLINGVVAVVGAIGGVLALANCAATCQTVLVLILLWGVFGITSAILLFKRYLAGLWGGCVFLLFQTIGISTSGFIYNPNSGLALFFAIGDETSAVSFNILAIVAITVLVSVFVRDHQAQESVSPGGESPT